MPIIKVYNPYRKPRKKFKKSKSGGARRNPVPGGVLTYMANPKKHHRRVKHHRRNPHKRRFPAALFAHNRKHYRRHNPVGLGDFKQLTIAASAAIVGGVVTRTIPETLLPNQNKGVMGYALNLATAFGLGMLGGKFMGDAVGSALVLGGFVMTASRIIDDYSPYKNLVEFGTIPGLSGDRKYALSGNYVDANFVLPQSSQVRALPPAAVVAAAANKPAEVIRNLSRKGGVSGGFGGGGGYGSRLN